MKEGANSFSQKVSIRNRAMIEIRSSFSPINFCFSAPIIPRIELNIRVQKQN